MGFLRSWVGMLRGVGWLGPWSRAFHYVSFHSAVLADEALQVLEKVRDCIRDRVADFRSTYRSHHCTVYTWASLLAVVVAAVFLLSNTTLHQSLAGLHLQWMSCLVVALVAAGAVALVCLTVSDWRTINGLEKNVSELNTLIKYHRSLLMVNNGHVPLTQPKRLE